MSEHPVIAILSLWPSRREVLNDARRADPSLDMIAVHRWFQRASVPGHYWGALLDGAQTRGFALTADDIVRAHVREDAA